MHSPQTSLAIGGADGSLRIFRQTNPLEGTTEENLTIHFTQDPHNCAHLQFDSPVVSIEVIYPPVHSPGAVTTHSSPESHSSSQEPQQDVDQNKDGVCGSASSPSLVVGTSVDGVFVFDKVNTRVSGIYLC
jgi:hypothetical protein